MSKDYSQPASDESVAATKQALESNGFNVEIVDTLSAAHDKVLELIPAGSDVFTGTSVTLTKTGLDKALNESSTYASARGKFMALYGQKDKAIEMRQLGSASDYAVGSVHAITEDGQVVIASASGSQLPNYVYGANHVIWVVGSQKVTKDLTEAMDRLETYTFPLEDARALKAYGAHSLISKVLLYKKEPGAGRITIVIIKEAVGF